MFYSALEIINFNGQLFSSPLTDQFLLERINWSIKLFRVILMAFTLGLLPILCCRLEIFAIEFLFIWRWVKLLCKCEYSQIILTFFINYNVSYPLF